MKRVLRRLWAALMTGLLIVSLCPALAEDGSIPIRFMGLDPEIHSLNAEYYEEGFFGDPTVYDHRLARASASLVVAAQRFLPNPVETQNENILLYLNGAGFEDVEADSYETAPTADSIANAIGHKTLSNGQTLVALATCGLGYSNEWLSNLNVGNEARHSGFQAASQKVQARLKDYMSRHGIGKGAVLWLAGFSRAAAVSNITAADMSDSGLFDKVFCYTFATPRTTRDRGDYPNIFNIVGSQDIVPQIPFAEWGYERYGRDLFVATRENSSDYDSFVARVDPVYRKLTGFAWHTNPELNEQLHQVLRFLYAILPDAAMYRQYLYPELCELWSALGTEDPLQLLYDALQKMENLPEDKDKLVKELADYLSKLTYEYTAGGNIGQIESGAWNRATSLKDNLMHEHSPACYLSAMLACDRAEQLFCDNPAYTRFVISGDARTDLYDEFGGVCCIDARGAVSTDTQTFLDTPRPDAKPNPYLKRQGTQTILTLPLDRPYVMSMRTAREAEIKYFGTIYSPKKLLGDTSRMYHLDMEPEQEYIVFTGNVAGYENMINGEADYSSETWNGAVAYSPGLLLALENLNFAQMDLFSLAFIFIGSLAVCMIALLICLILAIIRVARRKKRRALPTFIFHGLLLLLCFAWEEGTRYNMRGYPFIMSCFKGLASLNVLILAVKGIRRVDRVSDYFVCAGLAVSGAGDVLINLHMPVALMVDGLAAAIIALGYALVKKPRAWQYILWGVLTALFSGVIYVLRAASPIPYGFFIAYCAAFAALLSFTLRLGRRTILPAFLLLAGNAVLAYNLINGEAQSPHELALGLYYLAVFTLACSVWAGDEKHPLKEGWR